MFNFHEKLAGFHSEAVRLDTDVRKKLALHRDLNLERLNQGLVKIAEKSGAVPFAYTEAKNQGSYAMKTMIQHPENDYDIDIAVIFDENNLPSSPLDARKLVAEAMVESGGKFKEEPRARTNAVTIWYQEGHHVDFAVYRRSEVNGQIIMEHASTEWGERDPMEVNKWFNRSVLLLSPNTESSATVKASQLRRIVRLVKAFAKSRPSWSLPGGMIISTLVVESYKPDSYRDDISLYNTLQEIQGRLALSTSVASPVRPGDALTDKAEWVNQVRRLKETLDDKLEILDVLFDVECDEDAACDAWGKFFSSDFWETKVTSLSAFVLGDYSHCLPIEWPQIAAGTSVKLSCELLDKLWNPIRELVTDDSPVKDGCILKYHADVSNAPPGHEVCWQVVNTGKHAIAGNDLRGSFFKGHDLKGVTLDDQYTNYEASRYRGKHWIECFIISNDVLLARSGKFLVNIDASFLPTRNTVPFYRMKH